MHCVPARPADRRYAFTLVELAIVLTVIALIAGAILAGRELVHAATLRSAAAQCEQLQTAIGTFYGKYQGIPGDFSAATELWPAAINGNGDGLIDDLEANNVWHHMALARLIAGTFLPVDSMPPPADAIGIPGRIELTYLNVLTDSPYPAGMKSSYMTMTASPQPIPALAYLSLLLTNYFTDKPTGILPADAERLDAKSDDGLPLTGRIMSATLALGADDKLSCPAPSGANAYNLPSVWRTCGLWMRIATVP